MHIPDYFEFYNKTKISSGRAALENIPFELESMNSVKPLVLTDKKSAKNGVVKAFVKSFYNSGVTIGAIYDEVPGYASAALLQNLSKLFRDRGCDSIIAIGGSAVASAAKGLNILVSNNSDSLLKFEDMSASAPLKPFIVIPTSEAQGTETSNEAVIDSRIYKSDNLFADLIVIDKRMFKWTEKKDTASSAMLALTQAIEACTFTESNPINDSFAYASIEMVYENMAKALKCHCNKKEKAAFMNGVAISGIVYSNAPEGLARAIGFEMEKLTGHPAGLCAGLVLPYALDYKFRFEKTGVRGELLLPLAGIENYCSVHESERAEKSVELLYLMLDNLEGVIPGRIKDLNIPMYMINTIAAAAEARGGSKYGKGAALKILEHAYEGIPFKGGKSK
jgi:alcohol dehydrogenase